MRCLKPYFSEKDNQYYPCGRCLHCRIARREEWTLRMMKELEYWDSACFITLTYDDEHLPPDGGLRKKDLQLFFKRLRRSLDRTYGVGVRPIKYFACGEYGSIGFRPHYHAIIFGLDYSRKEDVFCIQSSWRHCSKLLWQPRLQRGRMRYPIGPAVLQTIRYVTGYVYKKAVDNKVDSYLDSVARRTNVTLERTFQLQSQGIGLRWCEDFGRNIRLDGYILCNGRKPVPRYFRKKLGIHRWNNDAFSIVCDKQKEDLEEFSKLDEKNRRNWYKNDLAHQQRVLAGYRKKLAMELGYESEEALRAHYTAILIARQKGEDVELPKALDKFFRLSYPGEDCFILNNSDYDYQRLHSYSKQKEV